MPTQTPLAPQARYVDLFPTAVNLPAPDPGTSYAVFQVGGMTESGVQAFMRLTPALAVAMARSTVPLDQVEKIARVAEAVGDMLTDRKLDDTELMMLALLLRRIGM